MTFCSPFPLTAVASSRKKQKEGIEVDIVRAKDGKKQCEKEAENYFYLLTFNCCFCPCWLSLSSPPSISGLIFLSTSLQKSTQITHCQWAHLAGTNVEKALLFLMRHPL